MTKIRTVQGQGRTTDRLETLHAALVDAIHQHGEGLPVAAVIGTLHVIVHEILTDQTTTTET